MTNLPEYLRGDGPCQDCGVAQYVDWFTDNVLWNEVMGGPGTSDDPGGIICMTCFARRVDAAGFAPRWRLLPDWHWETTDERAARMAKPTVLAPGEYLMTEAEIRAAGDATNLRRPAS